MSSQFVNNVDGLAQDCCNSIADAMELQQSCAKPSMWLVYSRTPSVLRRLPPACHVDRAAARSRWGLCRGLGVGLLAGPWVGGMGETPPLRELVCDMLSWALSMSYWANTTSPQTFTKQWPWNNNIHMIQIRFFFLQKLKASNFYIQTKMLLHCKFAYYFFIVILLTRVTCPTVNGSARQNKFYLIVAQGHTTL